MTTTHSTVIASTPEFASSSTASSSATSSSATSSSATSSSAARLTSPSFETLAELTDDTLLAALSALVKQEQSLTVAVLLHLGEFERRGLHLAKGCPSTFAFCVQRLGFSEDVAYKRVGAARYARRFPLALDLLTQGALHLSALMLVGPHLTESNHRDWLLDACHKTKREVEQLVAARCPKPDVTPTVRKLPERLARATEQNTQSEPRARATEPASSENAGQTGVSGAKIPERQTATQPKMADARAAHRPRLEPLSESSYRVVFTATSALKQKLDRASELCSHSVAYGDLPTLLERAIDLLIEREEKRRFAVHSPAGTSAKCASSLRKPLE